jgi:ATP-dependent Clp protease adaptor protein ClpS
MAWVVTLAALASLFVAVMVLAVVVVAWLASRGEGDDWADEPEPGHDESIAKPAVENNVPAATEESAGDYSAASAGPQYHLVLLNDDTHTYQYVIEMLRDVFGIPATRGFVLASEIDKQGRAVVFTGSLEAVNTKRTQVLARGPDKWARSKSVGPLGVVIEKAS